jgi:hypothetical protein
LTRRQARLACLEKFAQRHVKQAQVAEHLVQRYENNVERKAITNYLQTRSDEQVAVLHNQMTVGGQALTTAFEDGLVAHLKGLISSQRDGIEREIVREHIEALKPMAAIEFLSTLSNREPWTVLEQINQVKPVAARHAENWRKHYVYARYQGIAATLATRVTELHSDARQRLDTRQRRLERLVEPILNTAHSKTRGEWLCLSDEGFLKTLTDAVGQSLQQGQTRSLGHSRQGRESRASRGGGP